MLLKERALGAFFRGAIQVAIQSKIDMSLIDRPQKVKPLTQYQLDGAKDVSVTVTVSSDVDCSAHTFRVSLIFPAH